MPTAAVLREIRRATRPHGVAVTESFRLSADQLHRCYQAGALERPFVGVYVDPAVPRSPMKDLAVAVAAGGYMASAWGRSAAVLWGLVDAHPDTPEIVVPRQRRAGFPGAVVHRSTDLCWEHVTTRHHIRTTNPLITALDLGVVLGPHEVADVIITARQMGLFQPSGVAATLQRLGRSGRTGVRNVRQAMEIIMIGDRPADSVLELRFHTGPGRLLPPYEYQWPVKIDGKTYYIDFAYPAVKLAIEVDGYDKRRSRVSLDDDDRRQNKLVLDGWTVLRFTWSAVVFEPAAVAAQTMAALGTRGFDFRK